MLLLTVLILILLRFFSHDIIFFLIPVISSLAWAQPEHYNLSKFLKGRPFYLFFTACLTFIYYGTITEGVLRLQETAPVVSHILLVTNALAWAIIFEPVRMYIQTLIERRFNVRNREARKAVEAFTGTLREEINLEQLRERFLTVIQQYMQPYFVSFWVRLPDDMPEPSISMEEIVIADDDPLLDYLLHHPGVLKIDRLWLDSPRLQKMKLERAELLLAFANQGELLGLLILGPHLNEEDYTREERTLLETLALQVAPALRVAQLVRRQQMQVRERERIEQELRTAQAIQHAFLPEEVPALPGWQLAHYYCPAREVGGDFYDFLPFENGQIGIVIGDATGKGVPAALVMATTHTLLRSVVKAKTSPGEVLTEVNNLLCDEMPTGMFVTCFFAVLEPASGRLRYANAGHELPYCHVNGSATELWARGMPLGLMPDTGYEEQEVSLSPGESLLFYSDGLVEAHNSSQEMLGFPRLATFIKAGPGGIEQIGFLLNELRAFTGSDWEQEDDVTMLVLYRTPVEPAEKEDDKS
jgi:serine phosphatase RsbU (regulator of sigma subunit)